MHASKQMDKALAHLQRAQDLNERFGAPMRHKTRKYRWKYDSLPYTTTAYKGPLYRKYIHKARYYFHRTSQVQFEVIFDVLRTRTLEGKTNIEAKIKSVRNYNEDGKELTLSHDAEKLIGNAVLIEKYPIRNDIEISPEVLQLNERKVTIIDVIEDNILFGKIHWRLDISFNDLLKIAEQRKEDADVLTLALSNLEG